MSRTIPRQPPHARFAAVILVLVAGCSRAPELADLEEFTAANQALAQATTPPECQAAAARFEALLARGGENGSVLHALGNAWFRAGSKGQAIAAWRRALRLRPRDPWLAANLDQARLGLPTQPEPLVDQLLPWRAALSLREQAWSLTGAMALLCAALLARRLWPRSAGAMRVIVGCAGITALLAAATFTRTVIDTEFTRHAAIVVGPDGAAVVARKGDAASFAPALTEPLADGTECVVVDQRAGWSQIELPGGLVGWVPTERLASW